MIHCFSSQLLKGKPAYFQALEVLFGNVSKPSRNKKLPDLIKIKFPACLTLGMNDANAMRNIFHNFPVSDQIIV